MQLGETIATYDVDLALRGESGKFEVTSPLGETYYITCKPNESVLKSPLLDQQSYPQAFLVRKIAESISAEQANRPQSSVEEGTAAPDSRAPFLLDNRKMEEKSLPDGDPESPPLLADVRPIWNLELFCGEGESEIEQPLASVYLAKKGEDSASGASGRFLTPSCRSFNDLDSEIRKLQAQLEEIRARAKKRFYKAHAAASSA